MAFVWQSGAKPARNDKSDTEKLLLPTRATPLSGISHLTRDCYRYPCNTEASDALHQIQVFFRESFTIYRRIRLSIPLCNFTLFFFFPFFKPPFVYVQFERYIVSQCQWYFISFKIFSFFFFLLIFNIITMHDNC